MLPPLLEDCVSGYKALDRGWYRYSLTAAFSVNLKILSSYVPFLALGGRHP
jgi:hypothetical protein